MAADKRLCEYYFSRRCLHIYLLYPAINWVSFIIGDNLDNCT